MAKGSTSEVLVGLATAVPVGELILPRPESQSHDGIPDLVAARGIVRGVQSANPRFVALRVLRDIARHHTPNHGFGGQVSAHWDAEQRELFMGASPEIKRVAAVLAARQDGIVGHIHSVVEDGFESQELYSGPDGFRSLSAVRVIGSRVLTYNQLTDMFGPRLEELPDPLSHAEIVQDIRAVYASGVLAMANLAAA